MATTTPPPPDSDDAASIVGQQLKADLLEAGLSPPAARAMQHALELVVLRLLLVVATRQDLHDAANGLRREFQTSFDALRLEFGARFDAQRRESEALDRKIDDVRRESRWQFYILFALILMLFATMLSSFFV